MENSPPNKKTIIMELFAAGVVQIRRSRCGFRGWLGVKVATAGIFSNESCRNKNST